MVFEGADKVLEEDILKKKREFIPTEAEWSAKNRGNIRLSVGVVSGVADVYRAGVGRVGWISSLAFFCENVSTDTPASGTVRIILADGSTIQNIFSSRIPFQDGKMVSISFPQPLEIKEGEAIQVISGSTALSVRATIVGYEEGKLIS